MATWPPGPHHPAPRPARHVAARSCGPALPTCGHPAPSCWNAARGQQSQQQHGEAPCPPAHLGRHPALGASMACRRWRHRAAGSQLRVPVDRPSPWYRGVPSQAGEAGENRASCSWRRPSLWPSAGGVMLLLRRWWVHGWMGEQEGRSGWQASSSPPSSRLWSQGSSPALLCLLCRGRAWGGVGASWWGWGWGLGWDPHGQGTHPAHLGQLRLCSSCKSAGGWHQLGPPGYRPRRLSSLPLAPRNGGAAPRPRLQSHHLSIACRVRLCPPPCQLCHPGQDRGLEGPRSARVALV